ncbi:MAG: sigma-54-dependent Fis family transcriptional regulator [Deltaproteobacteria bacterium CG17_big_fil_post_rev_8_21_14_2_50_63_7]|nr:MAG: sigma-54-dependent Fis family transcriptional regulator [Deltaproteobacteria bacterium CG17_big_fil_post_rev_8_21_14_2_50_63_7]
MTLMRPPNGRSRPTILELLYRQDWYEPLLTIAEVIASSVDAVVRHWSEGYRTFFGEDAFFTPEVFDDWHRNEVLGLSKAILRGDPESLWSWMRDWARQLFDAGVPYDEIIFSIHLFEEACCAACNGRELAPTVKADALRHLDRLSHVRIMLLTQAYHSEAYGEGPTALVGTLAKLQQHAMGRDRFCGIIGKSMVMQTIFEQLSMVARSRTTVLLQGESGTGKELAARAIHRLSGDVEDRFVPINCAALPPELMESELFGHVRGAFSGANSDRMGLFEAADNGTLYLDEITELSSAAQAKLLRVLQEQAVRPVGALKERPISVRVIASSNESPARLRSGAGLRRDLYYRLQGFVVTLPPLRERSGDLPLLLDHFLVQANKEGLGTVKQGWTPAALDRLEAHDWPGNIRELQMMVRRLCMQSSTPHISVADLPEELQQPPSPVQPQERGANTPLDLKDLERLAIVRALGAARGNKSQASKLLGISRRQLYVKLERYEIQL